jgi:hypothetical protein
MADNVFLPPMGKEGANRPRDRRRLPPPPPPEICEQLLRQLPSQLSLEDCRQLVAALATERWSLRERIAERLADAGAMAVPELLEMLGSGLWFSRAATLKSLGRLADRRALLPVLEACWDQNRTVSEEAVRAIVGYLTHGAALAVAKVIHARGPAIRSDFRDKLETFEPEAALRVDRLWAARDLMGGEARLTAPEESALVLSVQDADWGFGWADLLPSEPLTFRKGSVPETLREMTRPAITLTELPREPSEES